MDILRGSPVGAEGTPQVILRGSPATAQPNGSIKHPKTGTTVDEAVAAYIDMRSPVASPTVIYMPAIKQDPITSPLRATSGPGLSPKSPYTSSPKKNTVPRTSGPGLTPRKDHGTPIYASSSIPVAAEIPGSLKRRRELHSPRSSLYETSSETEWDRSPPPKRTVVVSSNGDGTYSPVKSYTSYHSDDEEEETYVPPPVNPYDQLTEEQQLKMRYDLERLINQTATRYRHLGIEGVEESSMTLVELAAYNKHILEVVAKEEKVQWIDMGMEGIYNFFAALMEKIFDVPMRPFFDELKGRIRDWRSLIMENDEVAHVVQNIIPSVNGPDKKSLWVIAGIFFAQIAIGCGGAFTAKYFGGGKGASMASGVGASLVSQQLDAYMFKDQSIFETFMSIAKNALKGGEAANYNNKVDV